MTKRIKVLIYNSSGLIGSEKVGVIFETKLSKYPTTLYFYIEGFPLEELTVNKASDEIITVFIGRADQLNEVVLKAKEKVFKLGRLNDLRELHLCWKKNRVPQVSQIPAN